MNYVFNEKDQIIVNFGDVDILGKFPTGCWVKLTDLFYDKRVVLGRVKKMLIEFFESDGPKFCYILDNELCYREEDLEKATEEEIHRGILLSEIQRRKEQESPTKNFEKFYDIVDNRNMTNRECWAVKKLDSEFPVDEPIELFPDTVRNNFKTRENLYSYLNSLIVKITVSEKYLEAKEKLRKQDRFGIS